MVMNAAIFPQDDSAVLFPVHTSFISDTPLSPLPQPKHGAQRWKESQMTFNKSVPVLEALNRFLSDKPSIRCCVQLR